MLSYCRVHDLEDWSQHWNGRGLICAPSSLHLGIFIQLIFFLHNSSKINGTNNMILSICLVKIQYPLVLGCQFSVSPSLDTVPTGQNCSGKWLLCPPTVNSAELFQLHSTWHSGPSIVSDLSLFPVVTSSLFSGLPPCSSWFFNCSIKCILSLFLSAVKKCVCFYVCPFIIFSILTYSLCLTSIRRWQFSWVPWFVPTAADYRPPDGLP